MLCTFRLSAVASLFPTFHPMLMLRLDAYVVTIKLWCGGRSPRTCTTCSRHDRVFALFGLHIRNLHHHPPYLCVASLPTNQPHCPTRIPLHPPLPRRPMHSFRVPSYLPLSSVSFRNPVTQPPYPFDPTLLRLYPCPPPRRTRSLPVSLPPLSPIPNPPFSASPFPPSPSSSPILPLPLLLQADTANGRSQDRFASQCPSTTPTYLPACPPTPCIARC